MIRNGKPHFTLASLREADQLSEIIHKINHEIGNPLTSIISLSAIMERAAELSPEKISPYATAIASEAWRISGLSEKLVLLLSARAEIASSVNAIDVLRKALTKLDRTEKYHGLEPKIVCEEALPQVRAEFHQCIGLFVTLLENAFDAALASKVPPGQHPGDRVQIDLASDNLFVAISVTSISDAACPLSLDSIFDPFVGSRPKNLGLGLTVAAAITERFGGSISCQESTEADLSRFVVTVRLPGEHLKLEEHSEHGVPSILNDAIHELAFPITVVIIEDEPLVTSAIEKILWFAFSRFGVFRVVHLEAKEFLARLEKGFEFDAVLCDLHLGSISGRHVLDQVRNTATSVEAKFGFITGDRTRQETEKYLSSTGRPYLQKPFEPDELIAFTVELIRAGRKLR